MAFGSLENQKPDLEPYILKTGDTMTGQLILPGAPTNDLGAVPKSFVETIGMGGRQNTVQPNVGLKPIKNLKIAFDRTAIFQNDISKLLQFVILDKVEIPDYSANIGMLIELDFYMKSLTVSSAYWNSGVVLPSKYYISTIENNNYYFVNSFIDREKVVYDAIKSYMTISNRVLTFTVDSVGISHNTYYRDGPFFAHLKIATFTT